MSDDMKGSRFGLAQPSVSFGASGMLVSHLG